MNITFKIFMVKAHHDRNPNYLAPTSRTLVKMMGHQTTPPGLWNANHSARQPQYCTGHQDLVQTVDTQNTGEFIVPLCLGKIKSIHSHSFLQENLSSSRAGSQRLTLSLYLWSQCHLDHRSSG